MIATGQSFLSFGGIDQTRIPACVYCLPNAQDLLLRATMEAVEETVEEAIVEVANVRSLEGQPYKEL